MSSSALAAILTAVGGLLLTVGGFIWAARRDVARHAKAISTLRALPIAALDTGRLGAFTAKVTDIGAVDDPVTSDPVVFVEAVVERTADGRTERTRYVHGQEVVLEDGSGSARVHLQGAELHCHLTQIEETRGEPSPAMRAVLNAADPPAQDDWDEIEAEYVLLHRAISVGEEVTAIGVPRRRTANEDWLLHPKNGPVVVTPEPLEVVQDREAATLAAMRGMLWIGVGAAMITFGVALVLTTGA